MENAIKRGGTNTALGLRLAQLYLASENWQQVERVLLGVIKGKLTDAAAGRAWLLLGIARHNDKSHDNAKAAFVEAAKLNATKKDAEQWLAYLQSLEEV